MVDKIEMSLDDIIKSTKGMGIGRRRAPGRAPQGRGPPGRRGGAGGNFQQRGRPGGMGGVRKGRNAGGGIVRPTNGRFQRVSTLEGPEDGGAVG